MERADLLQQAAGRFHVLASAIEQPFATVRWHAGAAWSGLAADRLNTSLRAWDVICLTAAEMLRQRARAMVAEAWLLEP